MEEGSNLGWGGSLWRPAGLTCGGWGNEPHEKNVLEDNPASMKAPSRAGRGLGEAVNIPELCTPEVRTRGV